MLFLVFGFSLTCTSPPPPRRAAAVLGLHPGHADQPGEHDPGPHPLHAADVRGHGARRHGDGRQRAGGLPAEEGAGAPAHGVGGGVPAAQGQLKGGGLGTNSTRQGASDRVLQAVEVEHPPPHPVKIHSTFGRSISLGRVGHLLV